jgi:hypothetical protein
VLYQILLRVSDGAKDVVLQIAVVWTRALDVGSTDIGSTVHGSLPPAANCC